MCLRAMAVNNKVEAGVTNIQKEGCKEMSIETKPGFRSHISGHMESQHGRISHKAQDADKGNLVRTVQYGFEEKHEDHGKRYAGKIKL